MHIGLIVNGKYIFPFGKSNQGKQNPHVILSIVQKENAKKKEEKKNENEMKIMAYGCLHAKGFLRFFSTKEK